MRSNPSRKQKIRGSLATRLAAYAATAGAVFVVSPESHATITLIDSFVIHSTNVGPVGPVPNMPIIGGLHSVGFTAEGLFKFLLIGRSFNTGSIGRLGAGVKIATDGSSLAVNFAPGAALTAASFANAGKLFNRTEGGFRPSPADNTVTGYIGFKQKTGTHTYYGWLRVQAEYSGSFGERRLSLVDSVKTPGVYGAYDLSTDMAADHFGAGVPEPSPLSLAGLSLLALGAAGVREMRRRVICAGTRENR